MASNNLQEELDEFIVKSDWKPTALLFARYAGLTINSWYGPKNGKSIQKKMHKKGKKIDSKDRTKDITKTLYPPQYNKTFFLQSFHEPIYFCQKHFHHMSSKSNLHTISSFKANICKPEINRGPAVS